jgi:DNA-binding transcriptional regulator GbsR (MarR family)
MIDPGEKSNLMYDYLNQIPSVLKAQEIIKKVGETFEPIGKRIKYYDRPDDYIPIRGRKPKEKNEKDIDVIDITKTVQEPKEPGRRGRKPSEDTLQKLETKYYKMYDDLEKQLRVMRELSNKIGNYKKYFGK